MSDTSTPDRDRLLGAHVVDLTERVTDLADFIAYAARGDHLYGPEEALVALIGLIDDVAELRRMLATVEDDLHAAVYALMPERRVTINGVVWERTRPKRRTDWRSEDLLHDVIGRRHFDPETGVAESMLDLLHHVYNLSGSSARLTALRERGIHPDDYCVWEPGRPRVRRANVGPTTTERE